MSIRRTIVVLAATVSVLAVLGVFVGGGGVSAPLASAQSETPDPTTAPTPEPTTEPEPTPTARVVQPEALNKSVTNTWGTITASAKTLTGVVAPKKSESDNSGSRDSRSGVTRTTPTVAHITRDGGYVEVEFTPNNPDGHTLTDYKIERRLLSIGGDPLPGWRVIHGQITKAEFADYDVVPAQGYEYRITPHGTHVTTSLPIELPPGFIEYVTRPLAFLSGIVHDDGVTCPCSS